MNWLDPKEVGAWLAAHPHRHPLAETHGEQSALEQFVRALAETGVATYASTDDIMSSNSQLLIRSRKVARLLVKEMGEK